VQLQPAVPPLCRLRGHLCANVIICCFCCCRSMGCSPACRPRCTKLCVFLISYQQPCCTVARCTACLLPRKTLHWGLRLAALNCSRQRCVPQCFPCHELVGSKSGRWLQLHLSSTVLAALGCLVSLGIREIASSKLTCYLLWKRVCMQLTIGSNNKMGLPACCAANL